MSIPFEHLKLSKKIAYIVSQTEEGVADHSFSITSQVYLDVCMNTHNSVSITARDIKFGTMIAVNHTQIKLILNIGCHAQRLCESIFVFFKSIC